MISVVIPLYNKEKQIANALNSVLNQTYDDFEVIVVDDGSTDLSATIVEQYTDSKIKLIRKENGGVSSARNRGIIEAKSEYIAFLDADDEWRADFLQEISDLIIQYPYCKARGTNYLMHSGDKQENTILRKIPFEDERGILTNYFEICSCSHPPIHSSCICINKDVLTKIGGFPMGIKSGEDLITWARVAVETEFAYSLRPLAIYNVGSGYDYTKTPTRPQDVNDPVGKIFKVILKENPHIKGLKKYISRWHKMRASVALRYYNRGETLREACISLGYNLLQIETYPFLILPLLPKSIIKKILSVDNLRLHDYI